MIKGRKVIQLCAGITLAAFLIVGAIFIPRLTVSTEAHNSSQPNKQMTGSQSNQQVANNSQSAKQVISCLYIPTLSVEDFVGTSDLLVIAKIDVVSCEKIKTPFKAPANIDENALYDADLFTVKLTKIYKGRASDGDTIRIVRFSDDVMTQPEGAKLLAVGQKGFARICVFKDDEYPQIDGMDGFIPIDSNGNLSSKVTQSAPMFRNNQLNLSNDRNISKDSALKITSKTNKVFSQQAFEDSIMQIVNKNIRSNTKL